MPERRWAEAEFQVGGVRVAVSDVRMRIGVDPAAARSERTVLAFGSGKPLKVEFTVPLRGTEWRLFLEGLATPAEVAHRRILGCAHRSRRVVRRRLGRLRRSARTYLRQRRATSRGRGFEVGVARETLRLLARVGLDHPQAWRRSCLTVDAWESLGARDLDDLEAFAWDLRGRPGQSPDRLRSVRAREAIAFEPLPQLPPLLQISEGPHPAEPADWNKVPLPRSGEAPREYRERLQRWRWWRP